MSLRSTHNCPLLHKLKDLSHLQRAMAFVLAPKEVRLLWPVTLIYSATISALLLKCIQVMLNPSKGQPCPKEVEIHQPPTTIPLVGPNYSFLLNKLLLRVNLLKMSSLDHMKTSIKKIHLITQDDLIFQSKHKNKP